MGDEHMLMKPTCFANTNTAVIESPTGGFHHTIINQFYYDEKVYVY
jgi:hypothetical protein